jgi:hypothetical protein
VAAVDQNQERAQRLTRSFGEPTVLTDFRNLLALNIDLAIVALPNHLHAPVSTELLRAGFHVLVEKPMALSVAQCDEMLAAAEEGHALLAAGMIAFYPRDASSNRLSIAFDQPDSFDERRDVSTVAIYRLSERRAGVSWIAECTLWISFCGGWGRSSPMSISTIMKVEWKANACCARRLSPERK